MEVKWVHFVVFKNTDFRFESRLKSNVYTENVLTVTFQSAKIEGKSLRMALF